MPHNGNRLLTTVALTGPYNDPSVMNAMHGGSANCVLRRISDQVLHPTLAPSDVITADANGSVIGVLPSGYELYFEHVWISTVSGDRWVLAFDGVADISFGQANAYGPGTLTLVENSPNRKTYLASGYNSAPSNNPPPRRTITGITRANPAMVTCPAHGYQTGDRVKITDVVGMSEINNNTFIITRESADTFTLQGINSTSFGTYVSGGTAVRPYSGEFQTGTLCAVWVRNVTAPVTNLRIVRERHEAAYNAGARWTPEYENAYRGLGVLRWMNEMGGNPLVPGYSESAQIPPKDWIMGVAYHNPDVLRPATLLSENYWEITSLRPGKPTITQKMALAFKPGQNLVWHDFTLAQKGVTTRLTKANHGFSNGELIQRISWEDVWNPFMTTGALQNPEYVSTVTGLRDCWPVTVIDANTIEVPFDSSSAGENIGYLVEMMRPMRLKYGATTVYCHSLAGRFEIKNTYDPYQFGTRRANAGPPVVRGVFYAPPNKNTFNFLVSSNRLDQIKNLWWHCAFTNAIGAHGWFHPPHLASEELIQYMAAYYRDNLGEGQECIFEIGNEPWNYWGYAFQAMDMYQHAAFFSRDVNQISQGWYPGTPPPPNKLAGDWPGMQVNGHEIRACAKAAKAVHPGIKIAVNCQISGSVTAGTMLYLTGLWNNYPANDLPANNVDYVAVAPYHDVRYRTGETITWPEFETVMSLWKSGSKDAAFDMMRDRMIATEYPSAQCEPGGSHWLPRQTWPHLVYVQYEGGHHTNYYGGGGSFGANVDNWFPYPPGITDTDMMYFAWEWRRSRQAGEGFVYTAEKWVEQSYRKWPAQYEWVQYSFLGGYNWGQHLYYAPDPIWASDVPASTQQFIDWSTGAQNLLTGSFTVIGRPVTLTYTPAQVQPYYAMTKWNCFTRDLGLGIHNFTSHTFKIAFSLSTPQTSWTRLSDVPQIGTTGGYVTGGYAVTVTWAEAAGVGVLKIEDKEVTATSDGLSFRYAVLYNDTAVNDPLIGFYDFGPVTMQETDVLNINFDEAQGALRVQ